MKIFRNILMGACIVFGWTSCANEELTTTETRQGTMSLSVDKVAPSATRAVETADFPVAIFTEDGEMKQAYDRADQVPTFVKLPVGPYYAEAHTPGELMKWMEVPYYMGRDEFEILQNVNTVSTVTCRMANGGITVQYSEAFASVFAKCDVTVDDGSQSVFIYRTSEESGFVPMTRYLCYAEKTNALFVNVAAVSKEGYNSSMKFTLSKKKAYEHYDDDKEYFAGGDCVVISCDTVKLQSTEGGLVGITINANISFEESEGDFGLDVDDFVPEEEEKPGEGDSDAIMLNLPEDMVVSAATDPTLGDTYIAAEHGIKSIMVKMESTSADMMGALAALAVSYEGVDFVAGAEVVGNKNMIDLFSSLGQSLSIPSEGDTEYTFPIGNFFLFLDMLPGEHSFELVITDMKGNTKKGKLVLTVLKKSY